MFLRAAVLAKCMTAPGDHAGADVRGRRFLITRATPLNISCHLRRGSIRPSAETVTARAIVHSTKIRDPFEQPHLNVELR